MRPSLRRPQRERQEQRDGLGPRVLVSIQYAPICGIHECKTDIGRSISIEQFDEIAFDNGGNAINLWASSRAPSHAMLDRADEGSCFRRYKINLKSSLQKGNTVCIAAAERCHLAIKVGRKIGLTDNDVHCTVGTPNRCQLIPHW
jgi:hypothetical protein